MSHPIHPRARPAVPAPFGAVVDLHPDRLGGYCLALRGELDLAVAGDLDVGLSELLELLADLPTSDRPVVSLDLSALTFVDDAGLDSLLVTRAALRAADWRVRVTGAHGQALWVLGLAARLGWLTATNGSPAPAASPPPPRAGGTGLGQTRTVPA
jgi:anti-anti-sigma regulatory factor